MDKKARTKLGKKILPPNAKPIKSKLLRGEYIPTGISIVMDAKLIGQIDDCIYMAEDDNPDKYDWSFLMDQEINLIYPDKFKNKMSTWRLVKCLRKYSQVIYMYEFITPVNEINTRLQ